MKLLNCYGIECNIRTAIQNLTHADSDHGKYFGKRLKIGQACSTRIHVSLALSPSLQEIQMSS